MTGQFDAGYDIAAPTREQLSEIAHRLNLHFDPDELMIFLDQVGASIESYRRGGELPEPRPPVTYARTPGWQPTEEENPYKAWFWRCAISGEASGPLRGQSVAVKDSVCVAGVPQTNGSAILNGFMPDIDATVVTRVLEAGGELAGKAVAEAFGLSSGSNTAATGAVLNPRDPAYSAGGSSSGCASLVASGACDLAIGTDQGGSIRIPASLCGIVGLKPTFGLVPYTGILSIEPTLDHAGPMARDVAGVASLLGAIAGADAFDARQRGVPASLPDYASCTSDGVEGLKIGVLREGFALDGPAAVRSKELVRAALQSLADQGAVVTEVSVPLHAEAGHLTTPLYAEGVRAQLLLGGGLGFGTRGYYPVSVLDFVGRVLPQSMDRLSDTGKLFMLLGEYMASVYQGRYYARAQNQTFLLRAAYDAVLSEVDMLAMPTCAPFPVAQPLPANPGIREVFDAAFGYHLNTAPFNATEHPAISVPAGDAEGMPVGLMFVGRHFDEPTLIRTAAAWEQISKRHAMEVKA